MLFFGDQGFSLYTQPLRQGQKKKTIGQVPDCLLLHMHPATGTDYLPVNIGAEIGTQK